MPVLSVKERHERRRSSYRDGKLTHTRVFLVKTDDITDGTAVALAAKVMDGPNIIAAVPSPGQPHNKDGSAICTGLDAEPVQNSGIHFDVTAEYTGGGTIGMPSNPLDRPPEISYGSTDTTEPYFVDRAHDPKAVVNSAGDPFEQYRDRERGEMVITITINEPTHNPVVADGFSHTCNDAPATIDGITYATGTLKLSPITAQKIKERVEEDGLVMDFTYYRRTYVLKARKEGWKDKLLDVGLNEYLPDNNPTKPGKLRPIVDGANIPVKKPWPLNGEGRKMLKPTDQPAELEFEPYAEASWTTLAFTWSAIWE